jgi:hypothetical protein
MKVPFLTGAIILLALGFACEDEELVPPCDPCPPPSNLTQREHVLNNIEVAYNKRRIDKYDELLDAGFTFFLTTGDVGGGLPEYWGRPEEVEYNTRLFDPNYTGSNRCKRIQVDLLFEDGVQWEDTIPPSAPGETWYATTVHYEFKFDMEPDDTYISLPEAKATFTVRNTGTDSAPRWKLVEMRDLGQGFVRAGAAATTETTTLGRIKALYR